MTACKRCYGDGFAACMCDPLDAGVLSSDAPVALSPADADRVAALLEERPGPTEAMRALFGERRPVAGWKRPRSNRWTLDAGYLRATVDVLGDGRIVWRVSYFTDDAEHVKASSADDGVTYSVTTAHYAAEDALRAVLVDAAAALGLRVVPS